MMLQLTLLLLSCLLVVQAVHNQPQHPLQPAGALSDASPLALSTEDTTTESFLETSSSLPHKFAHTRRKKKTDANGQRTTQHELRRTNLREST
jgi:hypothetical protein